MKKIIIYIFIILVIIILGIIIVASLNPLRKSEEKIREDILKITPIGSSMEEVLEIIDNDEEWKIVWTKYEYPSDYTDLNRDTIIGDKSIRVNIGKYYNPFPADVEVYWGFNENSKLIEVGIRKTEDSL